MYADEKIIMKTTINWLETHKKISLLNTFRCNNNDIDMKKI